MVEIADAATVAECAQHLRAVAADVRLAGDVQLVRLSAGGVAPAEITLSDELWLIALRLDGRMAPLRKENRSDPEPD